MGTCCVANEGVRGGAPNSLATESFLADAPYNPPFPPDTVGTFSNHGIEPADYEGASWDAVVKTNQDRGSIEYPFVESFSSALFCVMDGHGRHGDKVSEFCIEQLHEYLAQHCEQVRTDPMAVLEESYLAVDANLRKSKVSSKHSGTTAVTCYLSDHKIWTANAGDSRAVIAKRIANGSLRAHDLSTDQNPDSPGEMERIRGAGGIITPAGEAGLAARVWNTQRSLGLSMARSLGDHTLAKYGVIATPVVTQYDVQPEDSVLVLASDGIWEFLSSQQVVDIVSQHLDDATEACRQLILQATARWREEEGPYRDDITATVVHLDKMYSFIDTSDDSPSSRPRALSRTMSPGGLEQLPTDEGSIAGAVPSSAAPAEGSAATTTASHSLPQDAQLTRVRTKSFRRRRLSVDEAQVQKDAASAVQKCCDDAACAENEEEVKLGVSEENIMRKTHSEPNLATKDRVASLKAARRRPSLSPDMDPSGKQLNPDSSSSKTNRNASAKFTKSFTS